MIGISDLNGGDQARLQAILLGRSEFEAFGTNGLGRPLTVWIMTAEALANIERAMGARSSAPPAPDDAADAPRAPKLVPISTGVREAGANVRPKGEA